jgi:hypothetical protein
MTLRRSNGFFIALASWTVAYRCGARAFLRLFVVFVCFSLSGK